MKTMKVKVVETYSGRALALRVSEKRFMDAEGWDWLTDRQAKRIERFFGKENAYYCKVYTEHDVKYSWYYTDTDKKRKEVLA